MNGIDCIINTFILLKRVIRHVRTGITGLMIGRFGNKLLSFFNTDAFIITVSANATCITTQPCIFFSGEIDTCYHGYRTQHGGGNN